MNKTKQHWIYTLWRPFLAWSYVAICIFDFIIGPIIYNVLQFYNPGQDVAMWQAITLQGGGLYHLSMGAIIGISTHGRTQEKIKGVVEASTTQNTPTVPSFGGGMMSSYSPAPITEIPPAAAVVSTGKFGAAPVQPEHPLL